MTAERDQTSSAPDPKPHVGGFVASGFEAVADEFRSNFTERGDVGAAFCVYRHGQPVVDLWGGVADPETGRRWTQDTVVGVFSCTKGVSAACVNLLIERGAVDPLAPLADYWPEFAQAGKATITVEQALSHQAGVVVVDAELTLDDCLSWEPVVRAIEAQPPIWEPGTAHGYHMRTYGWIVGELVRRVAGMTIGEFWRSEFAEPLGLDFWIGLPDDVFERTATIIPPSTAFREMLAGLGDDLLLGRVSTAPGGHFNYDEMWNSPEVRRAELPSSNGHGDARALARLYASLIGPVDGRRMLSEATIDAATRPRVRGPDAVILLESSYGLGFMLPPLLPEVASDSAFGHAGAGGSMAFADPDAGLGVAYVMNEMRFELAVDERSDSLVRAAYRAAAL